VNKYVVLKATPLQRCKAHEAIKKNDLILFKRLTENEKMQPLEEIGHPHSGASCLHYAAKCNSFNVLDYIISWLKENTANNFKAIMNSKDHMGATPAMLATHNDGAESLFLILRSDAVDFETRDTEKQSLIELVKKPKKERCWAVVDFMTKNTKWNKLLNENSQKQGCSNSANVVTMVKNTIHPIQAACGGYEDETTDSEMISNENPTSQQVTINDGLYVDKDFPPTLASICRNSKHNMFSTFSSAKWLRAEELVPSGKKISLYETMDPSDIDQGVLGTCYFLCTLAAIAEYPSRLQPIFITKNHNPNGEYSVKLFKTGVPTKVTVDSLFPCFGDRLTPMFSKIDSGEIWVMVLEKVWAKIYGDYCVTEYGFMNEAVEDLLGAPSEMLLTLDDKPDDIWTKLVETDLNKGIMGASTGTEATKEVGLVSGHAYSLLGVYEEEGYKIVKLRNPWGHFEWKGDLSDDSSLWTEELKRKVHYTKGDDGVFCMKFDDFLKYYHYISLCSYRDNWEYSYISSTSQHNHAQYFEFTLDQATDINLRVHQTDKRMLAETLGDKYQYSAVNIVVLKVDPNDPEADYTYISSNPKGAHPPMRSCWASEKPFMSLEAGTYVVKVKTHWNDKKDRKFTLSAYAPCKVEFSKIEDTSAYKEVELCAAAQVMRKLGKMQPFAEGLDASIGYDFFNMQKLVICVENRSNLQLTYDLNFPKMENLRVGKLNRASNDSVKIVVPSQSVGYAVLKWVDWLQGCDFSFNSSYEGKVVE
jgi:hypothetical protein